MDEQGEPLTAAERSRRRRTRLQRGAVCRRRHRAARRPRRRRLPRRRMGVPALGRDVDAGRRKADGERGKLPTAKSSAGASRCPASGGTALVGSPCDKACVGSASAFRERAAGAPEYGRCMKVAKGAGTTRTPAAQARAGPTATNGRAESSKAEFSTKLASGSVKLETVEGLEAHVHGRGGRVATTRGIKPWGTWCSPSPVVIVR